MRHDTTLACRIETLLTMISIDFGAGLWDNGSGAWRVAGHRLGLINPALYLLGALHHARVPGTGIVDVTSGNNSFGDVTGFNATAGYNMATGWGTIDAAKFVPALARIG